MYSILFSILLASTYVSAIPMPLSDHLDDDDLSEPKDKERYDKFKTSLEEANRRINNMGEVLENDPKDYRITKAFGPNANIPEISKVIEKLKTGTIRVDSMNPKPFEDRQGRPHNGATQNDRGGNPVVHFGTTFHLNDEEHQVGTLIHEATHALANTGDDHDTTNKRIIPYGETAPEGAVVTTQGGYGDTITPQELTKSYKAMTKTVSNTYQNADSYRVFASLCPHSAAEVKAVRKRGLGKDGRVAYYLEKRDGEFCEIPPNYYKEKAAAKAAAAKGTATAANKATTSTAAVNGKASTVKSTGIRGTAKGTNAVRKGKYTRKATGAKAGKGLKAVKGTKAVKGLRTAKGARTAKGLKTARPGKGLKGAKAIKSLRTAKGARIAKGLKTAKAGKGVKAVKGGKAIKGVKAAKGVKKFKASGAGKGVKVAKGIKAATGAQRTKGKSIKAVKATTIPKSTAAGKSAIDANSIARAFTKAASHAAVKAAVPKAAVKVSAAIPKKRTNLRRDVGRILDELE